MFHVQQGNAGGFLRLCAVLGGLLVRYVRCTTICEALIERTAAKMKRSAQSPLHSPLSVVNLSANLNIVNLLTIRLTSMSTYVREAITEVYPSATYAWSLRYSTRSGTNAR